MKPIQRHILFCEGSDCKKKGSKKAYKHMKNALKAARQPMTRCSRTKCLGACKHAPVMVVYPDGTWYSGISDEQIIKLIVDMHIVNGQPDTARRLHQMQIPSLAPEAMAAD
ncbi:MAG: (2Fe-2S) ferredoxin domain-containing protein [Chloroflexota bacterium]